MRDRNRTVRREALIAFGAVLLLAVVLLGLPWALRKRDIVASVPVPPDLRRISVVHIPPRAAACTYPVVFGPSSGRVRFVVETPSRDAPPLHVQARAPGYRATATVPGGYGGPVVETAALRPASAVRAGRLCLLDGGATPIGLEGSASPRRATTTVAGRPARAAVVLTVLEPGPASIADRVGAIARHISAFRPSFVGVPLLAVLGGLLALLLAVGLPRALTRSLRDDERTAPDRR